MPIQNPSQSPVTNKPTAAKYQTYSRKLAHSNLALTSGRLQLSSIDEIPAGETISSITFGAHSTALAGGTHGWAALYDENLNLLGQSANDTGITWAALALKTFTLATPVVIPRTGLYYIGLSIVASTMPTVGGATPTASIALAAPATGGRSTASGLTSTAPNPAAAITADIVLWGYVS